MSSTTSPSSKLCYDDITPKQQDLVDALYGGNVIAVAPVGFGKAVCAQTAAQELIEYGVCRRVLVVAPLKVAQLTWATEWEKWSHLWPVGAALGTASARSDVIDNEDYRIVVINIENLPWMYKTYGRAHGFDGLVIDEVSKFKAPGSKCVRAQRTHTKDYAWRVGLSATPLAEQGLDIYAQAAVIDPKVLGSRFEAFKRRYFYPIDYQGYDWRFQPGGQERLVTDLVPLMYLADGAAYEEGLPPLVDKEVVVELDTKTLALYAEMAQTMVLEAEDIEAVNAAVASGKLQQITQGAVYDEAGASLFVHDTKREALLDLVVGAVAGRAVLVMYQYVFELDWLRVQFPGIKVLGEDPVGVERAWNAGELPMVAIHPKSASHGLNLQAGGYTLVCLSPTWSADQWEQVIGRIRRRGQPHPFVERYTIIAEGTIDRVIQHRLAGKAGAEASLMSHLEEAAKRASR